MNAPTSPIAAAEDAAANAIIVPTDPNTRITLHFTLGEMCWTQVRHVKNVPDSNQWAGLQHLCEWGLEPLRTKVSVAVGHDCGLIIKSGLRIPAVNVACKGSTRSRHLYGRAADIEVVGAALNNKALACLAAEVPTFDKVILEFAEAGNGSAGWVHVQMALAGLEPRRQYFWAVSPQRFCPARGKITTYPRCLKDFTTPFPTEKGAG